MTAAAIAVVAALAACGGDGDRSGEYSEEVRQEFVRTCQAAGESERYCGCVLNVISARVPVDDYRAILEAVAAGTGLTGLPDDVAEDAREALDAVQEECGPGRASTQP